MRKRLVSSVWVSFVSNMEKVASANRSKETRSKVCVHFSRG